MKRIIIAAMLLFLLAACSNTSPKPVIHRTTDPHALAAQQCEVALQGLYSQLGGDWGIGQFQAAVNAEAFNGSLPAACETTVLTRADLMALAATAAS